MLSLVQYVNGNIEKQELDLHMTGLEFEETIYYLLSQDLRDILLFEKAEIYRTEKTRDGGIDIIVQTKVPLNLFGHNFSMLGKKTIKIYIECKSSKKRNLQLEKISSNLLMLKDNGVDYFMIVSNSTITPHTFYKADDECKNKGIIFKFVGQLLLAKYLYYNNNLKAVYKFSDNIPSISICYQTEKIMIGDSLGLCLYIVFRNNQEYINKCTISLKSDRNWTLSENNFEVILDSLESKCKKLLIKKVNYDGNDDILLDINYNGNRKVVQISGVSLEYNFQLPFTGTKHKSIKNEVIEKVMSTTDFSHFCIIGKAGIGKSRIIEEAINRLLNCGCSCYKISIIKSDNLNDFYIKLRKKLNLKQTTLEDSLEKIFYELTKNDRKRYYVVIEDIHNAPPLFFKHLKDISVFCGNGSPLTLTVTGRNDFSIFNESFYNYIEWKDTTNNKCIEIETIEGTEFSNLVKSIINDAPEFVINTIIQKSNNNPFYLVQYIEYLLETKIIILVNRSTVSVINAATFNHNFYMPNEIEELIKMRINILKSQNNKLYLFLMLVSFIGNSCPKEMWYYYFDESEQTEYKKLFANHFLKLINNEIVFDHESIFLFLKAELKKANLLKQCFGIYISSPKLFSLLPELKKGEIYAYLKNWEKTYEKFKAPINELKQLSNISSVNLEPMYYSYYTSIYEYAKAVKDVNLQEKTILAIVYVGMHNCSSGEAILAFEKANELIAKDYNNNSQMQLTIDVLYAHFLMSIGQMSKSKKYFFDFLALERLKPGSFDDQTLFNIFDRVSSMFLQENHINPAIYYNRLSRIIAEKLDDKKLLALSYIILAKIYFYIAPQKSLKLIQKAEDCLSVANTPRIMCHNKIGKLTVRIMLDNNKDISMYIKEGKILHREAVNINYPLAIIRIKYLLAVLFYLRNKPGDIETANKYLDEGIEASIRNGNIKLLVNYYNMKMIIAYKENQPFEIIYKHINTMIEYLKQQNLLFIGAADFGNGNIININNIIIFFKEYLSESACYEFLKQISFYGSDTPCDHNCKVHKGCNRFCTTERKIFLKNYNKLKENVLLFVDSTYTFKDNYTIYYIPIGI